MVRPATSTSISISNADLALRSKQDYVPELGHGFLRVAQRQAFKPVAKLILKAIFIFKDGS
jgi:hypothetical protein